MPIKNSTMSAIAAASIAVALNFFFAPPLFAAAGQTATAGSGSVSVLDFGADPTCGHDSTAAINRAITAAAARSEMLTFPAGCFLHANLIFDNGVVLQGADDATEIRASSIEDPPMTAIIMNGTGAQLHNLKITTTWTRERQADDRSAAVLNKAANYVTDHMHIVGSAGVGYQCQGCNNGSDTNDLIENTHADGMYYSGCSYNITNSGNRAYGTGDDSFSINSYQTDTCNSHHFTFTNDDSYNSSARGFEVAGAQNVLFSGGTISNSAKDCIVLNAGSSPIWKLKSASDLTVDGVVVDGCRQAGIDVWSFGDQNFTLNNALISNVRISGIGSMGINIGEGKNFAGAIKIINSTFTAGPGNTAAGVIINGGHDITLDNDTFTGFGQNCGAASDQSIESGSLTINRVQCVNDNTTGRVGAAFRLVSTGFSDIHLTNNKILNGQNRFSCAAIFGGESPRLKVTGNTGDVTSILHKP